MIKINSNTSTTTARLFPSASTLLRRLCTAAVGGGGAETASSVVEDASSSAVTFAAKPASPGAIRRLRWQLFALGSSRGKVAIILHRFIMDGHRLGRTALVSCVNELRNAKRFHHCLEIFEWMDKGKYTYREQDRALRIDLIYKAKGVEEADKYFESLPEEAKSLFTYEALLNGYCTEKLVDKAASLFGEMDKLSYITTLAFNNMMKLALTTGDPEKLPCLVEEMKRKGIPLNSYSYSLLIKSYKLLNDMEGAEKAKEKIETAMKRLEESSRNMCGSDYHYLISFYATMGDLDAVNRVWDTLKSDFQPMTNFSYLVMLQSLNQLGQTDQLQACFEEWKAGGKRFDIRVVTLVMGSYLRQNRVEEAEQLFDDAVEKSGSPYIRGREMFISHFLGKREISSALTHLLAAFREHDRWQPDKEKVSAFLKYFEEEKDVDGAEAFSELLRKVKCLDSMAYISLLGTYAAVGKTAPKMGEMMKEDGIEITGEHEILLKKVCPE